MTVADDEILFPVGTDLRNYSLKERLKELGLWPTPPQLWGELVSWLDLYEAAGTETYQGYPQQTKVVRAVTVKEFRARCVELAMEGEDVVE